MNALLAVGVGAMLGAWGRWGLALLFNQGSFPMGTLFANLAGGYLMGVAMALFLAMPNLSAEVRLFVTTGFLGGLTTFSTFSAEAFHLLQRQQYVFALTHVLSHVIGSILLTALGYLTVHFIRQQT